MAIIPGEQKSGFAFVSSHEKKQRKLIYVLIAVLAITAGVYLMYSNNLGFFSSSGVSQTLSSPGNEMVSGIVEMLKTVDLNFSLLDDKKFQSLALPGDFPIVVGEKGRANPFVSF